METTPICISYGKATFPTESITVTGFVVGAPFIRTLAAKKLKTQRGYSSRTPAGRSPPDGCFYGDRVDAATNTIILIQVQKKHHGRAIADYGLFLRIRPEAPLISVTARMPTYHGATLGASYSIFEGRADIFDVAELAALGIEVPQTFQRTFMNLDEYEEVMDTLTFAAELAPAPRYVMEQSESGEKVVMQADNRVRRMRVRRP